jgi:hypothetical protein
VSNRGDPVKKSRPVAMPPSGRRFASTFSKPHSVPPRKSATRAPACAKIATRAKVPKREIYAVCECQAGRAPRRNCRAWRTQLFALDLPTFKDRGALALLAWRSCAGLRSALRAVYWLAISQFRKPVRGSKAAR